MPSSSVFRHHAARLIWFAAVGMVVGGILGHVNSLILREDPVGNVVRGMVGGPLVGLTIGLVESLVFFGRIRRKSFLTLLVLRTASYAACMLVWLTAVNVMRVTRDHSTSLWDAAVFYVLREGNFPREFFYVLLTALVFVWILQLTQLHRGRDLVNFILGRYHHPVEVDQVFLFVDLTSSTGIAEKLGHLEFSAFLQDFFFDVDSAVLRYGGSIYQYVGDEVIVSWPMAAGVQGAACVRCFFAMEEEVRANRERYVERYGLHPRFSGGLHSGTAVVTWVGGRKKEIVYHGDVLNTTARIQTEAKRGSFPCLVSDDLLQRLDLPRDLAAYAVGEVTLRGRQEPLVLHGLRRASQRAESPARADSAG